MNLKVFQKGFNYSQDGQGNRLIFHLQGCNMRCPWCSNPEGIAPSGTMMEEKEWLKDSCCPKGAVKEGVLDRTQCDQCSDKLCLNSRQKGIHLSCSEKSVEELVKEAVKSKPMFFDGGGVTLTGGEISMQFQGVKELLTKLGEAGIHRTIESNGTHPSMCELIPLVDEWIMDLKQCDDSLHKEWLGVSNKNILKNLEIVCKEHANVLIRIPLIPGFNDSQKAAEDFRDFLKENAVRENVRVELLTYHEFGKGKWEQCGMEYKMPSARIQPETVKYLEGILKAEGICVVRT